MLDEKCLTAMEKSVESVGFIQASSSREILEIIALARLGLWTKENQREIRHALSYIRGAVMSGSKKSWAALISQLGKILEALPKEPHEKA